MSSKAVGSPVHCVQYSARTLTTAAAYLTRVTRQTPRSNPRGSRVQAVVLGYESGLVVPGARTGVQTDVQPSRPTA